MKTKEFNFPWFHLNSFDAIFQGVLIGVLFFMVISY